MLSAVVNIEYEHELFSDITGGATTSYIRKARIARQYLYYFINSRSPTNLFAEIIPENETLDYLEDLGVKLPAFVKDGPFENWYGSLKDIPLERKLNSKLHACEFLKARGELPPTTHVVHSPEEISRILHTGSHSRWVLKSPYLNGGNGFCFIKSESDIPTSLPHAHILEPWRERVLDLSTHFDPTTGDTFSYASRIQANGAYLGGWVNPSEEEFLKIYQDSPLYPHILEFQKKSRDYISDLKKLHLVQPMTIDGFIYQNGGVLHTVFMSEINYRVNMGTLNQSLKRFLPEKGIGMILNLPGSTEDWKKVLPYEKNSKTGIISLNDKNPHLDSIFMSAKDLRALKRMESLIFHRSDFLRKLD